jgi:metal-sulfur cluster biosynthetic enzyme
VVFTVEDVTEVLRQVFDPELGLDIVELGLLYDVKIVDNSVTVFYSLTSIGCPAGPLIHEQILEAMRELPGVEKVALELTWDPPWTPERMSEDAKLLLGFGY